MAVLLRSGKLVQGRPSSRPIAVRRAGRDDIPRVDVPRTAEETIDRRAFSSATLLERRLENLQKSLQVGGGRKSRNSRRRNRKRAELIFQFGYAARQGVLEKVSKTLQPIRTNLVMEDLPSTSCGYLALPSGKGQEGGFDESLESLLDEGYEYITWDGRRARPLLDDKGVIFACLAGRPDNAVFDQTCKDVYDKICTLGDRYKEHLDPANGDNRRGAFRALNFGITHGLGTERPVNLHGDRHGKRTPLSSCVDEIVGDKGFRDLASFASYVLYLWAPGLYDYYKTELDRLWEKEPLLLQNFLKSVFPSATINFGPNVWTRRHRDSMNCAFGMCAIQALGDFDHTKGGHLVLPDLKMVIEFPSGSTILIPSATLTHSNVPVQPGEKRASFTQFCPGGLFRFIDCDFMTEKALKSSNRAVYNRLQADKPKRWRRGLALLSKLGDIVDISKLSDPSTQT